MTFLGGCNRKTWSCEYLTHLPRRRAPLPEGEKREAFLPAHDHILLSQLQAGSRRRRPRQPRHPRGLHAPSRSPSKPHRTSAKAIMKRQLIQPPERLRAHHAFATALARMYIFSASPWLISASSGLMACALALGHAPPPGSRSSWVSASSYWLSARQCFSSWRAGPSPHHGMPDVLPAV